jgi:hypothetical protein
MLASKNALKLILTHIELDLYARSITRMPFQYIGWTAGFDLQHESVDFVRGSLNINGTGSIVVSTLAEAHWFFERGFDDITYAVGIAPQRLDACAALIRRWCR